MSTKYIASNWRLPNKAGVDSYLNDNYGLTFDGTSELINLDDDILINSDKPFSCSFWCNVDSYSVNSQYPGIFTLKTNQSNGFMIFLSTVSSYLGVNFGSNSSFYRGKAGTALDIPINTWLNVVLTYNGEDSSLNSSYKIFINGNEKSITTSGAYSSVPNLNRIGKSDNNFLDGKLSELAVFNYALSSTQVSTLYGSSSLGAGNPWL